MSIPALIFWVLLAALVLLLVSAALRPDSFRVERSALMPANQARVAALINDFHQWVRWSPWEKIDPTMQRTYSGAASGVGAGYAWSSSGKAGAGRMEILECTESRILIRIDFLKPFAASNTVEFTLLPQVDSTQVNWAMYGPSPFISKLMGMVFNMDKMIGKDFAAGLVNMQAAVKGDRA
jgi:hypothetical protein